MMPELLIQVLGWFLSIVVILKIIGWGVTLICKYWPEIENSKTPPNLEVSGTVTDSEIDKNGRRIIHGVNLLEVSVVHDPPNPHCVIGQDEEGQVVEALPDMLERAGDIMVAHNILVLFLGEASASEGQTLRVRLWDRISKGEFYPFDSDAEKRLMTAIMEDE